MACEGLKSQIGRGPPPRASECREIVLRGNRRFGGLSRQYSDTLLVRPGDFVVADGDGVVVVPREYIDDVAKAAWDVAKGDKDARRKLYEKTSRTLDSTVK